MLSPYQIELASRQLRHVLLYGSQKEKEMPKVLTGKVVEKMVREGTAKPKAAESSRESYDWSLILSGQHVEMVAGEDFPKIGKNKEGKEFDRTQSFAQTCRNRAADHDKKADILFTDTGFIVTARDMTPEEIADKNARKQAALAKKGTAKASEEPQAIAVAGVAPE